MDKQVQERTGWKCPHCQSDADPSCMVCWLCSSSSDQQACIDSLWRALIDPSLYLNAPLAEDQIEEDTWIHGIAVESIRFQRVNIPEGL